MTYEQILDRDVPTIRHHVQTLARQGIVSSVDIFYRHEAIAGQSAALTHDMTADGWKPTGVYIPSNIPYSAYWSYLYQRLGNTPLFA